MKVETKITFTRDDGTVIELTQAEVNAIAVHRTTYPIIAPNPWGTPRTPQFTPEVHPPTKFWYSADTQ